jgi:hypothetical protein
MFEQLLTIAFCGVLPIAGIIVIAFLGTRARIEMANQVNRLKVYGAYATWAKQNGKVIWLERLSLIGFLVSFTGFIVLSPESIDLGRLAFFAFVISTILCTATFFLFYRRIMQAPLPSVPVSENRPANKVPSTIQSTSVIVAVMALFVYISSRLINKDE